MVVNVENSSVRPYTLYALGILHGAFAIAAPSAAMYPTRNSASNLVALFGVHQNVSDLVKQIAVYANIGFVVDSEYRVQVSLV
jgi:hypothetical protein